MKVLVLGGGGMLGHKLLQILGENFEVSATVRRNRAAYANYGIFDKVKLFENTHAENIEDIRKIIFDVKPAYIINCIGIIKQLPASKDIIKTIKINSLFPHQAAEIAANAGSKLITIGTDCVFDGRKGMYREEDLPDAADLYGKSKNLGEVVYDGHLTLRTSIIGRELGTAHSLIDWFLTNRGKKVRGFAKAIYTGFPTLVFAEIISDLLIRHKDLSGLFHVSSEPISKYELLVLAKKYFQVDIEIEKFDDFVIDRSLDSLKFRRATGFEPQSWEEMIKKMALDKTPYSGIGDK